MYCVLGFARIFFVFLNIILIFYNAKILENFGGGVCAIILRHYVFIWNGNNATFHLFLVCHIIKIHIHKCKKYMFRGTVTQCYKK